MTRPAPFDVKLILIGVLAFIILAAVVLSIGMLIVGEAVEHFSP